MYPQSSLWALACIHVLVAVVAEEGVMLQMEKNTPRFLDDLAPPDSRLMAAKHFAASAQSLRIFSSRLAV